MDSWNEVYKEPATQHEINEAWHLHERFMLRILQEASVDPRPILEVGIGTGAFTVALATRGYLVSGVDSEQCLVDMVNGLLDKYGCVSRCEKADAFALPYSAGEFSVAFSQGLMEHFEPAEIAALLREQLRVADHVVFSVPTPAWVNPVLVEPEYRRTEAELVEVLTGLGFVVGWSFGYWNGMHAVIVLHAKDQHSERAPVESVQGVAPSKPKRKRKLKVQGGTVAYRDTYKDAAAIVHALKEPEVGQGLCDADVRDVVGDMTGLDAGSIQELIVKERDDED